MRGLVVALLSLGCLSANAQWFFYEDDSLPRNDDGTLDVDAPAPRLPNGKPDLSGVWLHDNPLRYLGNIAADIEGGLPMRAPAQALYEQRMANNGIDNPNNYCLPTGPVGKHAIPAPFKVVQNDDLAVVLYESRWIFRQIFTDGRPLPEEMTPSWQGYSVGSWDGDTLVVESAGFNGRMWLDGQGHPSTTEMRMTERFSRPSFGRMVVEVTVDDPGAYTAPWTVTHSMHFMPDTDLIEHICYENNYFEEQIGER